MLDSAISLVIAQLCQRILGKFFRFNASQLKWKFWTGDISFEDVPLRVPEDQIHGTIGRINLSIPWRSLWTQSVQLKLYDVHLIIDRKKEEEDLEEVTAAASDEAHLAHKMENVSDPTYLSKLLQCMMGNIEIEINEIQIHYKSLDTYKKKVVYDYDQKNHASDDDAKVRGSHHCIIQTNRNHKTYVHESGIAITFGYRTFNSADDVY